MRRWAVALGLTAAIGFFVIATAVWIHRDTVPPLWDTSQYLQESEVQYRALRREGLASFLVAFAGAMGDKAPLITTLPLPLYALFGESHTTARYVNLAFLVVASLALFQLGSRLVGRVAGLLGVVALNTFPLVAAMSRHYLTEYGLMTLVILWMVALVRWQEAEAGRVPWVLGLLLGLGLLMKITFPLYVAAPTALVLARRRSEMRSLLADLGRIAVVAIPLAGSWYAFNRRSVLAFAISGGYGELARPFGTGSVLSPRAIGAYWLNVVNFGVSPFYCLVGALLAVAWRVSGRGDPFRPGLAVGGSRLLLAWWIVPFLVLTFGVNKEIRLIVPYLPALALLLGAGFAAIPRRPVRLAALAAVAALGLGNYLYYSFAIPARGPEWRLGGLTLVSRSLFWAHPPATEAWPLEQVVRSLAADAARHRLSEPVKAPVKVTVLFSHARISPLNLTYAATLVEAPIRFLSIRVGTRAPADELARRIRAEEDYLLTKTGSAGPRELNAKALEVLAVLQAGEPTFVPVAGIALPDGSTLVVHRRRSPASG